MRNEACSGKASQAMWCRKLSPVGKEKFPRLMQWDREGSIWEKQKRKGQGAVNRRSGTGTHQEGLERPRKVTKC